MVWRGPKPCPPRIGAIWNPDVSWGTLTSSRPSPRAQLQPPWWGCNGRGPVHCGQITQNWATPFWASNWTHTWKLLLCSLVPWGSPDPDGFLNHFGNSLSAFWWLGPLPPSWGPALVNRSSIYIASITSCLLPSLLRPFYHRTDSPPTKSSQDMTLFNLLLADLCFCF